MLKQTSLLWALNFSLVGHVSVFLLASSHFNPADRIIPKTEDVEITYFEIRDVPEWGNIPQSKNEERLSVVQAKAPVTKAPISAPVPLPLERGKPSYPIEIPKPKLVERSVPIPSGHEKEQSLREAVLYQEMNIKLKDPVFATYYQAIREKIRKSAKRRYEGKRDSGDVSIGFTLFSNGRLKEVSVLRETSQTVSNLRTLAVQSLVDASPFPSFPERFEREQLSFLVVLTFEPKP